MNTQKREIKEITELIDGLKVLATFGAKVVADGKVNYRDLLLVREFVGQFNSLLSAFDNVPEIVTEIEDLDREEMMFLFKELAKSLSTVSSSLTK